MNKLSWGPGDTTLISKTLLGGAAAGGTAALITSLLAQMRAMKAEKEEAEHDRDSTLFIPAVKAADAAPVPVVHRDAAHGYSEPHGLGSLALMAPAGLLAGLGGYHVVRGAFNKLQRSDMEARMQAAEAAYQEALLRERDASLAPVERRSKWANANPPTRDVTPNAITSRGDPLTDSQIGIAAMAASLSLPALASAIVSYNMMEKAFPKVNKKEVLLARNTPNIVIGLPHRQARLTASREDLEEKAAAAEERRCDDDAAAVFLLNIVLGREKIASVSLIPDMAAAAYADLGFVEDLVEQCGYSTTFDFIKGASLDAEPAEMAAGVVRLMNSPMVGDSFRLHLAAEIEDMNPLYVKAAAHIQHAHPAFTKFAADMARLSFLEALAPAMTKAASTGSDPVMTLREQFEEKLRGKRGLKADEIASLSSNTAGGSQDSDPALSPREGLVVPPGDAVDAFLDASRKPHHSHAQQEKLED